MVKLLKTLLAYKLKQPKLSQKDGGFTLIELLVGLVLAVLVILPLLGFMVNMLQTDRQEQAKASSEQEIQSALSYISRDLDQAVYIYDAYKLNDIQNSLPVQANSTPVLVFWKRQFLSKVIPSNPGTQCQTQAQKENCDDAFVYALVAYYLKTPTQAECTQADWRWSCTAQITRVLYKEAATGKDPDNNTITYKDGDNNFRNFGESMKANNLNLTYIEDIMNAWTSTFTSNDKPDVLIDYVDQTPLSAGTAVCPPIQRTQFPTGATAANYGSGGSQQVSTPVSGFYACVDSEKTTAQVVIRGNALARMRKKENPPTYVYSQAAYFPKASIQVRGRGLYSPKQTEN